MLAALHPPTLAIVCAAVFLMLAAQMAFVLLTRKTYAGFTRWAAGNVLLAFAVMLLITRNALPPLLSVVAGTYLFMLALALYYDGLTLFLGRKWTWSRNGALHALAILCALVVAYFVYVDPNRNARIVCLNIFRLAVMLGSVIALLPARWDAAYRLTAGVSIASAAMAAVRIVHALTSPPLDDMMQDGFIRVQVLIDTMLTVALTFAVQQLTQNRLEQELGTAREAAELASRTDTLTRLSNRFHFEAEARREIERARRYGKSCSVLLFDIDHFKRINDTFGHLTGDEVLRELARRASETLRSTDLLCRWGGEEFIVLLPVPLEAALMAGEKLRHCVADTPFATVGGVTISVGAAQLRADDDIASWTERADQALYHAKAHGRNRVEMEAGAGTRTLPLVLSWNVHFSCGDTTIDLQHKSLFEKSNLLLERCAAEDASGVREDLKELLREVERHFAYEEAVLAAAGYPELAVHRREHRDLRERGRKLLSDLSQADAPEAMLSEVARFVVQELTLSHLSDEDLRYVETLHRRAA